MSPHLVLIISSFWLQIYLTSPSVLSGLIFIRSSPMPSQTSSTVCSSSHVDFRKTLSIVLYVIVYVREVVLMKSLQALYPDSRDAERQLFYTSKV